MTEGNGTTTTTTTTEGADEAQERPETPEAPRTRALASLVGEQLRLKRTERSIKQEDLAAAIDLQQGSVSLFEVGRRLPTLDQLYKMARVMDMPPGNLLPAHWDGIEVVASKRALEIEKAQMELEAATKLISELQKKLNKLLTEG